jgi:hypothetical protein
MIARSIVIAASLGAAIALGCGEHPCTLGVGQPGWCTTLPSDAAPFCGEVCNVCNNPDSKKFEKACEAKCREVVGIPELTCEQLDPEVENAYRICLMTSEHPGCGGARW